MSRDDPGPSKRQRPAPPVSTAYLGGVRSTQRLPLSCIECSRRKIKCDRAIPCRQCIDRGDDLACRREEVAVKGERQNTGPSQIKRKTFEELLVQVDELSDRVKELERGARFPGVDEAYEPSRPPSPSNVDTTRLPGIMEEAALGIGETSRWKEPYPEEPRQGGGLYLGWYAPKTLESCLIALPSQSQARALVGLYADNAAWLTGSVELPTLLREQDWFWIQLESRGYQDDIWLALYLAVLSVSAFFAAQDGITTTHLTIPDLQDFGRNCFDAAVATIYRCDGITHPSIIFCQTIQTLGPAFHFTSNTSLHQSLVPITTSHARSLNLHLLGRVSTRNAGTESEIGRQVWWNQVEPDWTFLPYNRYYTISPRHFTTACPSPARGNPTPYRVISYRAAKVLCDLFGDLSSNQDPSYDAVIAASDRIREIREDIDREKAGHGGQNQAVNRIQQSLIDMTVAYREYQCHRLYFVKALTDARYSRSYIACINAAEIINTISHSQLPRPYLLMWNTAVMVVASGIILTLNHILKPSVLQTDVQRDRRPVVAAMSHRLRQLQDPSGIATRGATLIDHLLALGDQRELGLVKDVTVTREAVLELVASSQSTHIPDDVLWRQPPVGSNQPVINTSLNDMIGRDPLGIGSEDVNEQAAWMSATNGEFFNQHQVDFDFARLLGQIMPNAG